MKKISEWIEILERKKRLFGDAFIELDPHNWDFSCSGCGKVQWPGGGHMLDPTSGVIRCKRDKEEIT